MAGLTLAVIIATKGRAAAAGRLARRLLAERRAPDQLIFSVADPADAPEGLGEIVLGPPGLAAQRNRGMAATRGADVYIFFDDDFAPTPGALAAIEAMFANQPGLAGATGHVIADGIHGDEIEWDRATRLADDWAARARAPTARRVIGLYGCNMAVSAAHADKLRFDEALPLYGWQEDLDFGARLSRRGAVIRCNAFGGVHQGLRAARPREAGLGYAQIANPVYLMRGRHIPVWYLTRLMARNLAANHLGALTGDRRADRRGRLRGNWLALADLMRGASSPARAEEL